ncbi:MAG: aspartate carbamoyltransferase regulatory subunit [Candidatus Micrarchaeota archaeon]
MNEPQSETGPRTSEIKPRLTPIDNGTVLDHLPVGSALKIIQLLGLDPTSGAVTVAINTESSKRGRKDLLFIENMELAGSDLEKIGLLASGATWNTIVNKIVAKKQVISLPETCHDIIKCPNPSCITNAEKIPTCFSISEDALSGTCYYCERTLEKKELLKCLK